MPIEYLAGIVDGEGHFCRHKAKNGRGASYFRSRLIVSNTHLPLLEAIKETYGGFIRPVKVVSPISRKPIYHWIIGDGKCEALARELRPHLIVKQEQVNRILDYEKQPRKPRRAWNDPTLIAERRGRIERHYN